MRWVSSYSTTPAKQRMFSLSYVIPCKILIVRVLEAYRDSMMSAAMCLEVVHQLVLDRSFSYD